MTWKALGILCVALALGGQATGAAAAGSGDVPTVLKLDSSARFDAKGAKVPGQFVLNAKLTTADSKPVSEQAIRFYQEAALFGDRDAYIGSATTDGGGNARLPFQPAEDGTLKLTAVFDGSASLAAIGASTSLPVVGAVSPYKTHPLPLASVAAGLTWAVCAIAVSVWIVLIGILLRSVLGIRAAAREMKGGKPIG